MKYYASQAVLQTGADGCGLTMELPEADEAKGKTTTKSNKKTALSPETVDDTDDETEGKKLEGSFSTTTTPVKLGGLQPDYTLDHDSWDVVDNHMDSLRVSTHLFAAKEMRKRTYADFKSDAPTAMGTLLEGVVNAAHSQK